MAVEEKMSSKHWLSLLMEIWSMLQEIMNSKT